MRLLGEVLSSPFLRNSRFDRVAKNNSAVSAIFLIYLELFSHKHNQKFPAIINGLTFLLDSLPLRQGVLIFIGCRLN